MRFGPRKPSIKKSIKARTTGAIKRKVKSATNPLYGQKGAGLIKNPKKSVYNKVYSNTTFSTNPVSKSNGCLGSFLLLFSIPVGFLAFLISIIF